MKSHYHEVTQAAQLSPTGAQLLGRRDPSEPTTGTHHCQSTKPRGKMCTAALPHHCRLNTDENLGTSLFQGCDHIKSENHISLNVAIISAKCNTRPLPLSSPTEETQLWQHLEHHCSICHLQEWPLQPSTMSGLWWSSRDWEHEPVDRKKFNSFISSALKADCSSFTLLTLLHLHFLLLATPGWQFYVSHSCLLWKHINCINSFFIAVLWSSVREFSLCVTKWGSLNFLLRAMVYVTALNWEESEYCLSGNCLNKLSLTFFQLCIN